MNWKWSRVLAAAVALLVLSGCGFRRLAFWRKPPTAAVPSAVRVAMQKQTSGAFDPASGDRRLQTLTTRLKLDPQDLESRLALARLYETYGLTDDAVEHYQRVINLDGDNLQAVQGLSRAGRQQPFLAREVLPLAQDFARRHPDSAAALAAAAALLDAVGDLAAAETMYLDALQMEPEAAWLHNNLGMNLLLQNRVAAAAERFRRALELNPSSAVARNNLGVALARQGGRDAALQVFLAGGADRATAHNNLAAALLEQDRLEESRAELMAALAARSFFAPALENFRLLLEKDGERRALPGAVQWRPAIPAHWLVPLPSPPPEMSSREK
jgi:Tfp pilus assembly protein PilF